jgi:hypothetical protein
MPRAIEAPFREISAAKESADQSDEAMIDRELEENQIQELCEQSISAEENDEIEPAGERFDHRA